MLSLKDKTTLITGSAQGIGRTAALRFAETGSDLYLVDINYDAIKPPAKTIRREYGAEAEAFKVNLSRLSEIDSLWDALRRHEPDILVNNAGIYLFKESTKVDEELFRKTMAVNLEAVSGCASIWMVSRRREKGGIIINVASIEAILPFASNLAHYDVNKAGVIALTRALARDYGKLGFRINVVIPW